ncbi:MAG TPA: PleD family two-component system response regulator [Paracoccaceae bacterium]|nr:PleD family two-component system response regulator [Paracoccaceae bacterium]
MTARILVVDDVPANVKLLQARLTAEYFDVLTATSGPEALETCENSKVDVVLLDVMMPDMDGYEVCRRLKRDPRTAHLPVVLITALDQPADRVTGLEAGADDFLTKPVRDLQLFSRVKSLTRLKVLTDELRTRAETTLNLVSREDILKRLTEDGEGGRLLLFEEDQRAAQRIGKYLGDAHSVRASTDGELFLRTAGQGGNDLLLVSLSAAGCDPLRLVSHLRSDEATRRIPILAIAEGGDDLRTTRALELGANDYILRPIDRNELAARVKTQIKRKRYDDGLRRTVQETIELAVTDPLTGLHNRRFMETHLDRAIERATRDARPLALLIADIDHFKRINDGWGHDAGDAVLRQFADRLRSCLRVSDLPCRFGGEEFVVLMPDADAQAALTIAERIRLRVAEAPFDIAGEAIAVTVSAGFSVFAPGTDDAASFVKRADRGLYEAKRDGRNRVIALAA